MSTSSTARPGQAARGRWALRDRPTIVWLAIAVLLALVHRYVADSRWLMVHVVMLGAVSHSVLVWSAHFAQSLLKPGPEHLTREEQSLRLSMLQVGTVLILLGVPTGIWPLTVAGATLVALAVLWHGLALLRVLRTALPSRFGPTAWFYVAATVCLAWGATLGAWLGFRPADPLHGRLLVAHTMVNLLGWVGLTVAGTLQTLWPTILRTRIHESAMPTARRALPWLVGSLVVVEAGALTGHQVVAATGLVLYAVGWLALALPLVRAARTKAPIGFAAWSVATGNLWLLGGLGVLVTALLTHGTWGRVGGSYGVVTTVFVVGFALQTVLGALTYLLPAVLGGGPSVVRAGLAELERGWLLRWVVTNGGLLLCVLPVPSLVRVVASVLVLVALAAYLPLALRGIRAAVAARRELMAQGPPVVTLTDRRSAAAAAAADREAARAQPLSRMPRGQAVAGLAVLALGVATAVAIDPAAAGLGGGSTSAGARASGHTTAVTVTAKNMRFSPATITVPRGDRLVVTLVNADAEQVHDLVLATGETTGRLAPGATGRLEVPVVGSSTNGWCSIIGHRQMGMTLRIQVSGEQASAATGSAGVGGMAGMDHSAQSAGGTHDGSPLVDLTRALPEHYRARDAVLPPLTPERVRRHTLTVSERKTDIAPGQPWARWTYNGTSTGPVLHGRVGDVFEITLVNDGTMGHSIDFHAGALAPDGPMRTIAPGQRLTYRFTATRAGIWMYHCSTMPMSSHIAAGMHGAVVIEPDGLPTVDRSYVLVQSEAYLGADGAAVDPAKVAAREADVVMFNGVARQYDAAPLTAKTGERVRIWVLDAGPNRASSFHVVGGQFDTVWAEGAYRLRRGKDGFGSTSGGSQTLALQPAEGGFVELVATGPGHYPFVSHVMSDAELGAHGILRVTR